MIDKNKLIDFYNQEYEKYSQRKLKNQRKPSGFDEKLSRLCKTLRRERESRMSLVYLEDYHRQVRNMAYFSYRAHNAQQMEKVRRILIPELVRLDMGPLLIEEREDMDDDFFEFLIQENGQDICTTPLFEIYRPYKQMQVKGQIMELVPSRPELEFPDALEMKRKFVLHVGPTNSGKTFHSLERLKDAGNGVYLGPLRLLALEVYEKMHDYNTPCTMLTGQECIEDENARIVASTIEMADLDQIYDVAVIDEAQMIADPDRGHSWTKAILGLKAYEIHVCMSPAAEKVITHLIEICHDTYEIVRYERKTALVCEKDPFIFPESIRPGDALIVFSKKAVLDVAGRLEEEGIPASVIYGSLPPEIRRRQMHLFTSGETKVVVATDAIGMGLNLPVERIVFIQTDKFDGVEKRPLRVPEILQIAGRAGRFGIYDTGYVNAMGEDALNYITEKMQEPDEVVEKVSLGFPQVLLDMNEPMNVILRVWSSVAPEPPFEKVNLDEVLYLYDVAYLNRDEIDGFDDKRTLYRMISCPIDIKDKNVVDQWLYYCTTYSADTYLDFPVKAAINGPGIMRHETYYKELDLYYQFSQRMGKNIDEKWLAKEREQTENTIMRYLLKGKKNYISTCRYCGRKLPLGWSYGKCQYCFDKARTRAHFAGRH